MTTSPPTGASAWDDVVLEENRHLWQVLIHNPDGAEYVLGHWAQIDITETFEGPATTIEINSMEPALVYITELESDLLFFRNNVLLYRMRVVDSEDVFSRDAHLVRYECSSYEKLLQRRLVMTDWILIDQDLDAAWRLVDYAQDQDDLGITRDPTSVGGTTRQRTLSPGDTVFEAINDFAEAEDGFDWWIDQFLVWHAQKPRRGEIYGDEWQWGGEIAECGRQSPLEDYASIVMVTGATGETSIPDGSGGETVYPPPPPVIVELPVKNLGYWAKSVSYSDVVTTASLEEKANFVLNSGANMRPTYSVTLEPGIWNPNFRLGDTIYLRVDSPPRIDIRVPARIQELHLTCTTDGQEVVQVSLRAEESESLIDPNPGSVPSGRTIPRRRLHAWDDVAAIFQDLDQRTGRLERFTTSSSSSSSGSGGGGGDDARWGTAWGTVVPRTAVTNLTTSGTTPLTLHTLTANLVAGRRYQITVGNNGTYGSTVGDTYLIRFALDGTPLASTPFQIDVANIYVPPVEFTFPFTATTGSHTLVVTTDRVTPSGGTQQARWYASVEDVGPVSASAVPPMDVDQRWNTAWGQVARIVGSTDITGIGATETAVNAGSANFIVGRRYNLVIRQAYQQSVASDTFFIRAYIAGTQLTSIVPEATTGTRVYNVPTIAYTPAGGGSLAISVTVTRMGGGGVANCLNAGYYNAVIDVFDVGPATGAIPAPDPARPYAVGLRQRSIKPSNQSGFSVTEAVVGGLDLTVPSDMVGRWAEVQFSLRMIPTTLPPASNTVIVATLRAGSLTGASIASVQFPFHLLSTPYGWNLSGTFTPTGLGSGLHVITMYTDGTGTWQIAAGNSWSALYDMGPAS